MNPWLSEQESQRVVGLLSTICPEPIFRECIGTSNVGHHQEQQVTNQKLLSHIFLHIPFVVMLILQIRILRQLRTDTGETMNTSLYSIHLIACVTNPRQGLLSRATAVVVIRVLMIKLHAFVNAGRPAGVFHSSMLLKFIPFSK